MPTNAQTHDHAIDPFAVDIVPYFFCSSVRTESHRLPSLFVVMALGSFERRERAFEAMRPNPFNQGDEEYEDSEDEEYEDDPGFPEPDPEGASIELFRFLADLKIEHKLSAKDVSCIMFNARASGCKGPAVLLAKRPNAPSGHYNRHFRKALGLGKTLQGGYDLKLPGHDKLVGGTTLTVPTLLAHEQLTREVTALRESLVEREWAHDFLRHPVVVAASPSERVWPLALYLDGVPHDVQSVQW